HPLEEMRAYADLMLVELRKVIPAFLTRVDVADRGVRWSHYLATTSAATRAATERAIGDLAAEPRDEVTLTDFDPDGELKVIAAAMYAVSDLPDDELLTAARAMGEGERAAILAAAVGER